MTTPPKTDNRRPEPPPGTARALVDLWVHSLVRTPKELARRLGIHPATVRAMLRSRGVANEIARLDARTYLDEAQKAEQARQDDARIRVRAERAARLWDMLADRLTALIPELDPPQLIRALRAIPLPESYRLQRDASGRPIGTPQETTALDAWEKFRALITDDGAVTDPPLSDGENFVGARDADETGGLAR